MIEKEKNEDIERLKKLILDNEEEKRMKLRMF